MNKPTKTIEENDDNTNKKMNTWNYIIHLSIALGVKFKKKRKTKTKLAK